MSFFAGRIALGREGAYFLHESKQAVTRLVEKRSNNAAGKNPPSQQAEQQESHSHADALPEVLRHSLPSRIFFDPHDPSSLSTASKWGLPKDPNASSVSPDALNPLRAYLSLPQVTFGPKRSSFVSVLVLFVPYYLFGCWENEGNIVNDVPDFGHFFSHFLFAGGSCLNRKAQCRLQQRMNCDVIGILRLILRRWRLLLKDSPKVCPI